MKKFLIFTLIIFVFALSPLTLQAATSANPNANQKTKDLLNWLSGLKNRADTRVVSGMWMGFSTRDLNSAWTEFYNGVYGQSGKYLGLIGIEFEDGWSKVSTDVYYNQAWIDKCIWHWNQGGLLTIDWHPHNPFNDGSVNTTTGSGGTNLEQLITPGSTVYNEWMAKLDKMAVVLQAFENAGVTVIWRPFHEMNGSWFWWGRQNNSSSYVKLWQHMYNYYTTAKGLDNLLWVYSPNASIGYYLNTYPGDKYVDFVGLDLYTSSATFNTMGGYAELTGLGKPFALTEYGYRNAGQIDNINVINSIQKSNPLSTFIMYWNDYSDHDYAMTSHLNTNGFMNHPWIIDRSEVWGGNTSPLPSPLPSPSPSPSPVPTDAIKSLSGPTSVVTGQSYTVSVGYDASTARDIRLDFKEYGGSWTYYSGGRVSVQAGSGTANVTVPISSTAPVGGGFGYYAYIMPTGKDWSSRIADKWLTGISTVAQNNKKGDLNSDNKVDIFDYNLFSQNFGKTGSNIADLNNDSKVDIFDYTIFAAEFGR